LFPVQLDTFHLHIALDGIAGLPDFLDCWIATKKLPNCRIAYYLHAVACTTYAHTSTHQIQQAMYNKFFKTKKQNKPQQNNIIPIIENIKIIMQKIII